MAINNFSSVPSMFGWKLRGFSSTTVTIGPGVARAASTDFQICFNNIGEATASLTLNTAVVGANGCWPVALTSSIPASLWTGIYIAAIGDSSGENPAAVIAVTGDPATSLPPGYDSYRVVNLFFIDSTGAVVPCAQGGMFSDKTYTMQDAYPVLTAGAATSYTAVDLLTTVASPAVFMKKVDMLYTFTPNSASDIAYIVPTGLTPVTTAAVQIKTNGTVIEGGTFSIVPGFTTAGSQNSDASLSYKLTSASDSLSLWLSGFEMTYDLIG